MACLRGPMFSAPGMAVAREDSPPKRADSLSFKSALSGTGIDRAQIAHVQTIETAGVVTGAGASRGAARARKRTPHTQTAQTLAGAAVPTYSARELAAHPWSQHTDSLGASLLGIDRDAITDASDYEARVRALDWVDGLRLTCRRCKGSGFTASDVGDWHPVQERCAGCGGTGEGRNRGLAVAVCGRPTVAITASGHAGIISQRCRDRACPRCQRLRAIERAAELAEAMTSCPTCMGDGAVDSGGPCSDCGSRGHVPWRWHFLTLTVPKVHASRRDCKETIDTVLESWRALTRKSHAVGREFGHRFMGGVRSLEVVYRKRGEEIRYPGGRVHVVAMTGWHVHLHVILDVRESSCKPKLNAERKRASCGCAPMRWVIDEWCNITGAVPAGQHGRPVERNDTGVASELCKYIAKPLSQKMERHVGRELFQALHGRRCLVGFGRWRSWRKLATKTGASLLVGPRLDDLTSRVLGEPPKDPVPNFVGTPDGRQMLRDARAASPLAVFEGSVDGVRFVAEISARQVWHALKTGEPMTIVSAAVAERGLDPPAWDRKPFAWSKSDLGAAKVGACQSSTTSQDGSKLSASASVTPSPIDSQLACL